MTNATDVVAPPRTPAARGAYTEQLHVLVDMPTREFVLGVASETAREAGYKFLRQGETVRDLLAEAIAARYEADPDAYARAVLRGREILAVPVDGAAPRPA
jgi:hypothetical protein